MYGNHNCTCGSIHLAYKKGWPSRVDGSQHDLLYLSVNSDEDYAKVSLNYAQLKSLTESLEEVKSQMEPQTKGGCDDSKT